MKLTILILSFTLLAKLPLSAQPWSKPFSKWSGADAQKILTSSPWVKRQRSGSGHPGAVTVRWEGSAIVQEALRRTNQGPATASNCSCYRIAVLGLPDQAADSLIYLRLDGTEPVPPFRSMLVEQAGDRPYWVFFFRRNEDMPDPGVFRLPFPFRRKKSVDFHVRFGSITVEKTFVIADMRHLGKLDL